MTKFSVLERAVNSGGIYKALSPMLAAEIDLCRSLCREGLLIETYFNSYAGATYHITNKGREFVKANEIPTGWL